MSITHAIKFYINKKRFLLNLKHKNRSIKERMRILAKIILLSAIIWSANIQMTKGFFNSRKISISNYSVVEAAESISFAGDEVAIAPSDESVQSSADIESMICEIFKDDCNIAIAVAKAESGLNPKNIGDKHLSEPSYGLFQISRIWHDYSEEELLDSKQNIKIAYKIAYSGRGWENWTTYRNGDYLKYLK